MAGGLDHQAALVPSRAKRYEKPSATEPPAMCSASITFHMAACRTTGTIHPCAGGYGETHDYRHGLRPVTRMGPIPLFPSCHELVYDGKARL
jgi:hypothetical protein